MLKRTLNILKNKSKEITVGVVATVIATGTISSVAADKIKLETKLAVVYACGDSEIAKLIMQEQSKNQSLVGKTTNALAQTYASIIHSEGLGDFFIKEARNSYVLSMPKSTIGAESYFENAYKTSQQIAERNKALNISEILEKNGITKEEMKENFVKSYEARGRAVLLSKTPEIIHSDAMSFEDFKGKLTQKHTPEELEQKYTQYLDGIRNKKILEKEQIGVDSSRDYNTEPFVSRLSMK